MISKIDLKGEWSLFMDKGASFGAAVSGGFEFPTPEDSIILPGTTSSAGKGKENTEKNEGCLTDTYKFEGTAYYFRTVDLGDPDPDTVYELYLERTRMTRVWVNGCYAGECRSLCTPHIRNITKYLKSGENTICVAVCNIGYPTKGGHMTSADTQTNWNGITGETAIIVSAGQRIAKMIAYPDISANSVRLRIETEGITECDAQFWGVSSDGKVIDKVKKHIINGSEVTLDLGEKATLWSEYDPITYTVKAAMIGSSDIATVTFGMREVTVSGMNILLNGRKIHLRGRHDGMIFPLTGAAPTTIQEWHDYLYTVKSWGFNHVRFHTCCPPDAAFSAADMLGMYLQPELPFWGTFHGINDKDVDLPEQEYLIEEGRRILRTFGDHPSFLMMSLGNELWGDPSRLNEVLGIYRSLDSRHLYTQGSNNFQFYPNIQPNDDFFPGVRLSRDRLIRGSYADCDAPLGFVQTEKPNTVHSFDEMIFPKQDEHSGCEGGRDIEIQYGTGVKKIHIDSVTEGLIPDKPIITHETGQYCSYPDYRDIPKYTGSIKPRCLEIFRDRLAEKGLLHLAEKYSYASGMAAFGCYKTEIEAAMRSEYISGFQLLDIQDFTGQGMAFVGMLNGLMEEKAFVREEALREKWLGFCSDCVILCQSESFVLTEGQKVNIPVILRYTGIKRLTGKSIKWRIGEAFGEIAVPDGAEGIIRAGEISFVAGASGKYTLALEMESNENSYDFWVYPPAEPVFDLSAQGVRVITDADELLSAANEDAKVLYIPKKPKNSVKGLYSTDFWCYPMFRSISESMNKPVPVGTLGLHIDSSHPSLSGFFSESYSTPNWYEIVMHSDSAVLDGYTQIQPIVRTIDNVERNHSLGLLFEAKLGGCSVMICTARLYECLDKPEVQAFAKSVTSYMRSEKFSPEQELPVDLL